MLTCINKESVEYRILKQRSGIPESILEAVSRSFLDKYNRFPYLDELPSANSESYLRNKLKINQYNGTEISRVLDETQTNSIEEANAQLNDEYRDLEIELVPLNTETLVDVTHKPTTTNFNVNPVEVDNSPNNYIVFNDALVKLANLYGIKFNDITEQELNTDKWRNIIKDPSSVNAFIYDNQVYINTSRQSVDAPLHEMMHIFVGSIRFQNPQLYQQLLNTIEKFPNYINLTSKYQNRTRNDIDEEILVSETSKFLTGQNSNIQSLPANIQYELNYNIKRLLDIILMGQDSVKTISNDRLFNMSLKQLTQEVNSSIMTNQFKGTINVNNSELHRKLNNIKSDLYKKGLLTEVCT